MLHDMARVSRNASLSFFALFLFFAGRAFCQQSASVLCEIPVVVTRFNASSRTVELVKDLRVSDFEIRLDGGPRALESAAVDSSPKRIALILDTSKRVPEDEWTFEVQMAAKLTEYARPEDRFAIVLGGAEGVGMAFESPANTRQRLKKLKSSRPVAVDSARIYDALLAASSLLTPVRFGDTLFLFGRPEDSGSKADLNQITESILRNRLRLYGESFYDPLAAQLPSNFDPNKPIPSAVSIPKLVNVSAATGYYISFHATKTLNVPGQTRLFESFLGDLYAGVAEPYRLRFSQPSTNAPIKLAVSIKDAQSRELNESDIHYPRSIYACSQSAVTAN